MRMAKLIPAAALLLSVAPLRADDASPPFDWHALDKVVGSTGVLHDDVYSYTLPRGDLDVAVDGMAVPAAAGIASEFHFFRCSCGKTRVVGQFCCADYEANDVVDAIRLGAMIQVGGMGPMFTGDKPRITIVRFQGEGDASALAKLLHDGLGWMGDARMATQQAVQAPAAPPPAAAPAGVPATQPAK
jgi:hypothetical protein